MAPYIFFCFFATLCFPFFFSGCPETLFGKENEWEKGFPGVNNNSVVFPLFSRIDRKNKVYFFPVYFWGNLTVAFFRFFFCSCDRCWCEKQAFFPLFPEPQMFLVFSFFPLSADNWEEKEWKYFTREEEEEEEEEKATTNRVSPHIHLSPSLIFPIPGGTRSKKAAEYVWVCVFYSTLWRGVTVSHIYKCRKRRGRKMRRQLRLLRDTVFYSAFFMRECEENCRGVAYVW